MQASYYRPSGSTPGNQHSAVRPNDYFSQPQDPRGPGYLPSTPKPLHLAPAFLLQDHPPPPPSSTSSSSSSSSSSHNNNRNNSASSNPNASESSGLLYDSDRQRPTFNRFDEEFRRQKHSFDLSKPVESVEDAPSASLNELPSSEPVSFRAYPPREFVSSTFSSPTQYQPEDDLTDASCWVTVFGFPLSLSSLILQHFESDGEIVQFETDRGNWISIKFRSPLDARKALGKNGKIIADNVMIGVIPTEKVKVKIPLSGEGVMLPASSIKRKDYRPSGDDYSIGHSGSIIAPPQPRTSMFSTISDYLFGW